MGFAFLQMFLFMRVFPLTVQDRVIRLEMRLRLERILSTELKPRIPELTARPARRAAIRARRGAPAPDPGGPREEDDATEGDQARIRDWQADHLRA